VPTPSTTRLALVGDRYNHDEPSHPHLERLLPQLGIDPVWVPTGEVTGPEVLAGFPGVWVVPGGPYKDQAGVHRAIRFARESRVPFLGTCGGFFSALIEYAQNELRLPAASGVDDDPEVLRPMIAPMACSVDGERAELTIEPGSRIAELYGATEGITEVFQCQWTLTGTFMEDAARGGLRITARDIDRAPRAVEITDHPFFVATLFQPELSSTPEDVHPLVDGFLSAVRAGARELVR